MTMTFPESTFRKGDNGFTYSQSDMEALNGFLA